MFGKLLKYDFRSMLKQFAFIWPAALALALVNHFTVNSFVASASDMRQTVSGIAMVVYIAILMSMFVIALIFAIQRFYRGLLGDEGYLMFTLPVRAWQLIGSKLLCAVVTTFLSVAVALLSILVILPWDGEDFRKLAQTLAHIFSHWDIQVTHVIIGALEVILFMLTSFAVGYLQLYLAMSVGHLFSKNRVAWSVVAAIVLSTVVNSLVGRVLSSAFGPFARSIEGMNGAADFHAAMWTVMAGELVLSAIYFAGTEYILRKRLNLE